MSVVVQALRSALLVQEAASREAGIAAGASSSADSHGADDLGLRGAYAGAAGGDCEDLSAADAVARSLVITIDYFVDYCGNDRAARLLLCDGALPVVVEAFGRNSRAFPLVLESCCSIIAAIAHVDESSRSSVAATGALSALLDHILQPGRPAPTSAFTILSQCIKPSPSSDSVVSEAVCNNLARIVDAVFLCLATNLVDFDKDNDDSVDLLRHAGRILYSVVMHIRERIFQTGESGGAVEFSGGSLGDQLVNALRVCRSRRARRCCSVSLRCLRCVVTPRTCASARWLSLVVFFILWQLCIVWPCCHGFRPHRFAKRCVLSCGRAFWPPHVCARATCQRACCPFYYRCARPCRGNL